MGSFSGEGEADEEDSQQTLLQHISGHTVKAGGNCKETNSQVTNLLQPQKI